MAREKMTVEAFNKYEAYMFQQFIDSKVPLRVYEELTLQKLKILNDSRTVYKSTSTENDNINKAIGSRPAILDVILKEFGQKPISFLELLGDGVGAEFYATWLNIFTMSLIERDKKKYASTNLSGLLADKCEYYGLHNLDLNDFFKDDHYHTKPYCDSLFKSFDVINLDFCTYFYDNGKQTCTAAAVDNMFKYNATKPGGLVFFTFNIKGIGVNFHKRDAIVEEGAMFDKIKDIATRNGYEIEKKLFYVYHSGGPTYMANLGIKII